MFGDLHIGELLEEVVLMRRALEGIRDELAQANAAFTQANALFAGSEEGGRPAWVRSVVDTDV